MDKNSDACTILGYISHGDIYVQCGLSSIPVLALLLEVWAHLFLSDGICHLKGRYTD